MDEATKAKIFEIIQKEVSFDPATLDADGDLREQVSLDSMQFVGVMARIEKEFDIEMPISAMEASTLNEFLNVVQGELDQKAA